MNATQARPTLSRRDFLKAFAFGVVATTGGYIFSEYTPWLNYNEQTEKTWGTVEMDSARDAHLRGLVYYATLAANGHNTQPWKFALRENAIEIHPDYTRRLPVVDPNNRELWISLGCALENLLIAARNAGFAPEVTYPDIADFICVRLSADAPWPTPLFQAIPMRQNTRSEYDGRLVKNADFDDLQALASEPGVVLRFLANPSDMEIALDYVIQGNLIQYADKAFLEELIYWLRFNKKEALKTMDGLYSGCSGNPQVPRWLGQLIVSGTNPGQQADADVKKYRTSPAAVVIASEVENKSTWVRTGQVYERLALTMTSLDIKSAFMNQPIEIADLRGQFQSAIGLGNLLPQLLLRFGYANAMPKSLRHPLEDVLI